MEVLLREWERASAGPKSAFPFLNGLFLDEPRIQRTLQSHPLANKLRVSECRHGLVLEARQHVGVLQLGPLRIRIRPKMETTALWSAISYALELDEIIRHAPTQIDVRGDFADLLALMLLTEAQRLRRLGVQRGYRETHEWRSSIRGRVDLIALTRRGPLTEPALPCRHHAFTADIIENRVVLAGLVLASSIAQDLRLRSALHRAAQQWSTICTRVVLDKPLLDSAQRSRNRLTTRYVGVHRLIGFLFNRTGLDDEHLTGQDALPGFLWNMASLFERFVARFLREHLPDHQVLTQESLHHLYSVVRPGPALKAPRQRPDMVIRHKTGRTLVGVFDTKYRDFWATRLPREVLYQMSVYSLAWPNPRGTDTPVVILYPTVGTPHPDMEIRLRVAGSQHRRIVLRAVEWGAAAASKTVGARIEWAQRWILGNDLPLRPAGGCEGSEF